MSRIASIIASLEEHAEEILNSSEPMSEEELANIDDEIFEDEESDAEVIAEVTDVDSIIGEMDEEIESLESFLEVLKLGVANEEYSTQIVALAHTKLEPYTDVLERNSIVVPAIENYGKENLSEYYTVAVESFTGLIARIVRVVPAALERLDDKLDNWLSKVIRDNRPKRITSIADSVIGKSGEGKENTNRSLKKYSKLLVSGDQLPKDASEVIAFIKRNIDNLETVYSKVILPYSEVSGKVYGIVSKAKLEGGPQATSAILKDVLKVTPPFSAVTPAMKDGSAFIDQLKVDVIENSAAGGKLSEQLSVIRKNRISFGKFSSKPKAKLESVEFTPTQVVEIARLAKRHAVLLEKVTKNHGQNEMKKIRNYVQAFQRNNLAGATLATWEDDKAMDYAVDYALKQHGYSISNIILFMNNVYFTGVAVARLAKYLSK